MDFPDAPKQPYYLTFMDRKFLRSLRITQDDDLPPVLYPNNALPYQSSPVRHDQPDGFGEQEDD